MHPTKRSLTVVLFLLVSMLPAAAQIDDILHGIGKAREIHDATRGWTPEQEDAVGRAAAAKMIHIFGLYNNPAMTNYVNLVGDTVAQFGTRAVQYHFAILDTPVINAFAMPGGYVFITRGALENMGNESELAGVLAHEVAHVDRRHLERTLHEKKLTGIGFETGAEVGTGASGAGLVTTIVAELAAHVCTFAVNQHYSPDKEREADKLGTDLAAKAGYDASGLLRFLTMLQQATDGNSDNRPFTGMLNGRTHPPLKERVAKLTELSATYPAGGEVLESRYRKNVVFETDSNSSSAASKSAKKSGKKSSSGK